MPDNRTEALNTDAAGLDARAPEAILRILAQAQAEAAVAVQGAIGALAQAARAIADSLDSGGRVVYAAAGSSGLMALADALEMPGTFGIPSERMIVVLAGGMDSLSNLAGGPEDDAEQGRKDIRALALTARDCVLAVSASGSTPFAVGALEEARRCGARTIGMANNAGSPLLGGADISVALLTPPEVIAGSTRMGAGTAQKIAFNMISTLAAVHLGHVHDGYMVNLRPDNAKLRDRAARMVAAIAQCSPDAARGWLQIANGSVKIAVLLASGAVDAQSAQQWLDGAGGKLRVALGMTPGLPPPRA